MAGFQTEVLRDGGWVTTTVSTQAALDATAKIDASRLPLQTYPPRCGVLTRTVVPSPVAHWVLPIRIRSRSRIDVAFVGSHAVQISELRRDGQLINVARKDDFGSRICNAVVMGDTPNTPGDIVVGDQTSIKIEDVTISDGGGSEAPWTFEMMHYQTPWAIKNLTFRLAIDPTSRYLAAASSQKAFMIWELESRENIEEEYRKRGTCNPLRLGDTSRAVRSFQGTLFHLEFLFPRPEDVDHIILMMVVARRDCNDGPVASRVLTFDWIAGEDLSSTIEGDANGIRLPEHYSMPLMIIPLRFKNSLCVVSEHSIGVIKNAISGSMVCDDLMTERPPRTPLHYGAAEPLWAAWARPIRGDWYCKNTDIIMLAREDGYLVHIEVDAANVVPSVTSAGCLDSTISTGFAMPYIDDADAIIVSGDSSPGGTWKLSPRDEPVRASILRNWSPVVDITAAPLIAAPLSTRASNTTQTYLSETQILATASGRGVKGTLSTFRWGRQARIGCDIDTESTIRQMTAFIPPAGVPRLLHVALSLPESTLILQLSQDLTEVRALDEEETPLDLGSRTIRLQTAPNELVQVTETCIVVVKGSRSFRHSLQEQEISRAEHAICTSESVVLSSLNSGGSSVMHAFEISFDGIMFRDTWHVQGEVTCLGSIPATAKTPVVIVAGTLVEGCPCLSLFDLHGRLVHSQAIAPVDPPVTQQVEPADNASYEGFTSLHILEMHEDGVILVAGTLWGRVLTVHISLLTGNMTAILTRRFGKSAVRLYPLTTDELDRSLVATCDDNLVLLSEYDVATHQYRSDAMIIPMSDDDSASVIPSVQWVTAIPQDLQIGTNLTPFLLLAGSRVLIAELSATSSLLPRSIPMPGTPTKIVYSELWKCYIVAVTQDRRPTVHFVDPTTGSTISQPTNNAHDPVDFASGLGTDGDRVLCMEEWPFVKDGKTFQYILLGMQSGVLLTMSVRDVAPNIHSRSTRQVQYWMRHKRKGNSNEPVYAVLGVADGYVHCSGNTVYYEVLETQEKRMRQVSFFKLDSPALALQVRQGKLFVLTSRHSLLVLDHRNPSQQHPVNQMVLWHADKATRSTIHMIPMNVPTAEHPNASITMLSDASGNVVGVWTALGKKEQTLETVFRANLPVPIRRFVKGRCRPPWYASRELGKFGTVRATSDDADTFGVSLDGALYHFIILTDELCELLQFIQSHAERTSGLAPAACLRSRRDPEEHDRGRHIDGDLLARCSRSRGLEGMMAHGDARINLFKLLNNIEAGALTKDFGEGLAHAEKYFELAYQILEYLDTPVL